MSTSTPSTSRISTYTAGEICGNGIDDDDNGLVDDQDFQCYFSTNNVLNCKPSTILWFVNSGNTMYYYDTVTRKETEHKDPFTGQVKTSKGTITLIR